MSEQVQAPQIDPSNTTVQDMFAKVLHERIQSGALEVAISKQVDSLIESTAKDVLRSYSDVGKKVEELMKNAILPQIDSIDGFPNYHEFVVNRLRLAAKNFYDARLQATLDKELSELFTEIPEKATLSWIIGQIVKEVQNDDLRDDFDFTLPMSVEQSGSFLRIYIHDKPEYPSKYEYRYQIHLHAHKGKNELYSLKIADEMAGKKLSFGPTYKIEKVLFHLYAMRGHIEIDKGLDPDAYDRYVEPTSEYD